MKLDLVTVQDNLTGKKYLRGISVAIVVPHFDNHPLLTKPVLITMPDPTSLMQLLISLKIVITTLP